MVKPWKTTRTCNHSRWLSWHNMYKSCKHIRKYTMNHWTVIMSHYRNYMTIILLLRITRDSTHPSHPTERFQRRCKAVDRHSAESNQWNGGIQQKHRQFLLWAAAVRQKLNSTILYILCVLWTEVNRLGRLQRFPGAEFNHNHSAELLRPGGHQLLGATARWSETLLKNWVVTCFLPQPATAVAFSRLSDTFRVSPGSMNQSIMISVPRPGGCWLWLQGGSQSGCLVQNSQELWSASRPSLFLFDYDDTLC